MKQIEVLNPDIKLALQENTVVSHRKGLYERYQAVLVEKAKQDVSSSMVEPKEIWPQVYNDTGFVAFDSRPADDSGKNTIVYMQKTDGISTEILPDTSVPVGIVEDGMISSPNDGFNAEDLQLAVQLSERQQAVAPKLFRVAEQQEPQVPALQ